METKQFRIILVILGFLVLISMMNMCNSCNNKREVTKMSQRIDTVSEKARRDFERALQIEGALKVKKE